MALDLWRMASETAPVFTGAVDLLRDFESAWPGLPPVKSSPQAARKPLIGATISPDRPFPLMALSPMPNPAAASGAGSPPGGNDKDFQVPFGYSVATPRATGREQLAGPLSWKNTGLFNTLENYEAPSWVEQVPVFGLPSLNLYMESGTGDTVIQKRLWTHHMDFVDQTSMAAMQTILDRGLELLMEGSAGGYTTAMLKEMGHPYGFDRGIKGGKIARTLPRSFSGRSGTASLGHVRGIRGSVPSLAITNEQSGTLRRAWQSRLIIDKSGYTLEWRNTAKTRTGFAYPWTLVRSTPKMKAHGPFSYMPVTLEPLIRSAHAKAVQRAYHRERLEDMLSQTLMG